MPGKTLDPAKFRDPSVTATGKCRARVPLASLETLWVNTGTLCNLTCAHCYIDSSPRNDRLVYLRPDDLAPYLDEIARDRWPVRQIGFTGGEPFLNPDLMAMLSATLDAGFSVLVLTNAMVPLAHHRDGLLDLKGRYGDRLALRVSVDHYVPAIHEAERGIGTWAPMLAGLTWLIRSGFRVAVAGRMMVGGVDQGGEAALRAGFARWFAAEGFALDADDPEDLVVFPEMDPAEDVPEITEECWDILGRRPDSVMCAGSRMLVRRKGAASPVLVACPLLAYDPAFEMGRTLAEASGPVALNHPFCAAFCVLGGAACCR